MNSTAIKNILTPLIGIAVAWLASKFPLLDPATWNTLVTTVVFAVVAVITGIFSKTSNLVNTVGNQPGTTVVTTPAVAASLPDNTSVIASTPAINAAVAAAK